MLSMYGAQLLCLLLTLLPYFTVALPWKRIRSDDLLTRGRLEVPILQRRTGLQRRITGQTSLGDSSDLQYTISMGVGNTSTIVLLDTGSSDLWVISDQCTAGTCTDTPAVKYTSAGLNASGVAATLNYGDSKTLTTVTGPIGRDIATLAGVALPAQPFVAVNFTNNSLVSTTAGTGAAGLFGLGFPTESILQSRLFKAESDDPSDSVGFFDSTARNGPIISRLAASGALDQPLFAVALQRDQIDPGSGAKGTLTLGALPDGVANTSLTWVPVKRYATDVGGARAPSTAPDEVYPLRWEVEIQGVYLDGHRLPDTNMTGTINGNSLSALIDSGNSLVRGPADVVSRIYAAISPAYASDPSSRPTFPCAVPHTLAFQIGGQLFPVDPRDFMAPLRAHDDGDCVASRLVTTDPPEFGATFTWSLGDPFLKSALAAFYFGNLTQPSVDPPRVGFMSTAATGADAAGDVQKVIKTADKHGDAFGGKKEIAPCAGQPTTTIAAGGVAATGVVDLRCSKVDVGFTSSSTLAVVPHIRGWYLDISLFIAALLTIL